MALSRLSSVLAMCGTPLLTALEQMAIWLHELQTGVEYVRLLLQFRTDGRPAREDYCAQWCGRAKMGLKLTDASSTRHLDFLLSVWSWPAAHQPLVKSTITKLCFVVSYLLASDGDCVICHNF